MPDTPRLWSWQLSPFAGKVRVALAVKGVEVELLEINPADRPPRLRELNPSGRVPVLEVDGVAIRESSAICDWLEDTHPSPPLWPSDPAQRAAARGIMRWVDDELTTSFFLSMRLEAFGLTPTDHPDAVQHLRDRLAKRWKPLEALLGKTEGPWLMGGDEPTLADLAATPLAVRLPAWRPDLVPAAEDYPRATAWLEALRGHPAAVEVDRKGQPVGDR
jgi:glutathione S-transferase